jgi:isopenicillin N synthase-like dioxygenase
MTQDLPIIDMARLFDAEDAPGHVAVAKALACACEAHGFFYLTGHGVSVDVLEDLENQSRAFFDLLLADKMKIAMVHGGRAWRGYFPLGDELTSGRPDLKEGLYLGTELGPADTRVVEGLPLHGANLWPAQVPELQAAVTAYMKAAVRAAGLLMQAFSVGLDLDPDYFARTYTGEPTVLFRIFRYPAAPLLEGNDAPPWGVGEHTDYGLLTLLAQDRHGGLQVRTPPAGSKLRRSTAPWSATLETCSRD